MQSFMFYEVVPLMVLTLVLGRMCLRKYWLWRASQKFNYGEKDFEPLYPNKSKSISREKIFLS